MNRPILLSTLCFGLSIVFSFAVSEIQSQKMPFGIDPVQFSLDANLPGAYEIIAAKHINCDTTLTFDELIFLYYGAAFRPGYEPYGNTFDSSDLIALNREERYEEVLVVGMDMLYRQPANARAYWELGAAHMALGNREKAECFIHQYYRLISVPYYSGDGSEDNPFFVINVGDEYLIIDELEFDFISQTLIPPLDIMKVYDSYNDLTLAIYFDISLPIRAMAQSLSEEVTMEEEEQPKSKRVRKNKKARKKGK